MQAKLLHEAGERTYALVFETGEEPMSLLAAFAQERGLKASRFTAIGAFSEATLAYFDWDTRRYVPIPVREQVEVLALTGDIAMSDGRQKVHAHAVLGTREGHARGGHLMDARVRPTLEVMLEESPRHLERVYDSDSGLALIRIRD